MKPRRRIKGEATRQHVLDTALSLFRERGFERTTMRDVAAATGLAVGAAYHYFPSKDAIVLAWYERTQEEHARQARAALVGTVGLRARLGVLFHGKLDILVPDRLALMAVFRTVREELTVFGSGTAAIRDASMATFCAALADEPLPDEVRPLVGAALWMLHLGLLLYFSRDDSPGQKKTRALTDGALDLVVGLLPLFNLPALAPLRTQLLTLVARAGLVA